MKKSLIVEHIFWGKNSPLMDVFGPRLGLQATIDTELSEKVQYSRNQATKNSLNEAILLMSINEALLSR